MLLAISYSLKQKNIQEKQRYATPTPIVLHVVEHWLHLVGTLQFQGPTKDKQSSNNKSKRNECMNKKYYSHFRIIVRLKSRSFF